MFYNKKQTLKQIKQNIKTFDHFEKLDENIVCGKGLPKYSISDFVDKNIEIAISVFCETVERALKVLKDNECVTRVGSNRTDHREIETYYTYKKALLEKPNNAFTFLKRVTKTRL